MDGQGTTLLRRLGKIYIEGLTIKELTNILNKEYSKYLINPDVEITIERYRPIKVYVSGEVDSPGIHVLPGSSSPINSIEVFESNFTNDNINQLTTNSSIDNNIFFPSVIDALRKSGGITTNADLSKIEITRKNNLSSGGGRISTTINLLETFDLKDLSQNLRILDGDTITIKRSETPLIKQLTKAIQSNINPKFIDVLVAGRVERPGSIKINKAAVLNDAVELAGGTKFLKGPVNFIRYNNDGTIDKRKFNIVVDLKEAHIKTFLRSGDFIYVGKVL